MGLRWRGGIVAIAAAAATGCAGISNRVAEAPRSAITGAAPASLLAASEVTAAEGKDGAAPADAERAGSEGAAAEAAAQRDRARGFVRRGVSPEAGPFRAVVGVPADEGEEITLEFDGADLASVVQLMMEDGLAANYVIDPNVTGVVTIRTNRPLMKEEILPTLEEILRMNNAAIVERDGLFRIVPRAEAGFSAPFLTSKEARSRGLSVRVTPLRFVTVDDVSEVLESFAPFNGSIRYDRRHNLVFSVGTAAEQATILDAIGFLDANYFIGRSLALQPLTDADPALVIDELTAVFATPSGAPNPALRFLPIDRMNAVFIIADEPTLLDEALSLAARLDQGGGDEPTLHVFSIKERRASDVAVILADIFNADVSGVGGGSGFIAPGLTPQTDRSQPGDFPGDDNSDAGAAVRQVSVPRGSQSSLGRALSSAGAGSAIGGSDLRRGGVRRVVADESSNAIIALATADGAKAIESALRKLDVLPLQVLIEATLLEVSLNDRLEYGVRWFLQSGDVDVNFSDVAAPATFFPGFNAVFSTDDVNVTVSALDDVTDVRILSSPTLMVLDNQLARLQIGAQVPITVRSSRSTIDPDAPIVTEQEFRDTGVILQIRPTVSDGGTVILEVLQEVSDAQEAAGGGNPTISQRLIESTIAVKSGDTVALAGLIEESANVGRAGIPGLSRLPLIGGAFGTTIDQRNRSELLVLIRPIVIRDQANARAATQELRQRMINIEPALVD